MAAASSRQKSRRRTTWLAVLGVVLAAGLSSGAAPAWASGRASSGANERPADTGPSGVFNPSHSLQNIYSVGANGGVYLWVWTGRKWANGSLWARRAGRVGYRPSAVYNPSNGLQDIYHVGADGQIWLWAYTGTTRLTELRWIGLPRGATVAVKCSGRGCPARSWSARPNQRKRLRRLTGARFRAGDTITITISQRGRVSERMRVVIRFNRIPKAKLL